MFGDNFRKLHDMQNYEPEEVLKYLRELNNNQFKELVIITKQDDSSNNIELSYLHYIFGAIKNMVTEEKNKAS